MSDSEIKVAAAAIFDELLADHLLTTAISAHREIKRARVHCGVCNTRCRTHNLLNGSSGAQAGPSSQPLGVPSASQQSSISSRATSPPATSTPARAQGFSVGPEKGTGGGTGIGSGSGRVMDSSGAVFFECLVCHRQVASNRYAPHLAGCLGYNGSSRRGAARSAAAKVRLGANDRSSPSPYANSENGDSDVDSAGTSKKVKRSLVNGSAVKGRSPSKAGPMAKKARLNGSGSATPSAMRTSHQPSRLYHTTLNTGSPPSSPTRSIISIPGSTESGDTLSRGGAGAKNMTSLPGMTEVKPEVTTVDDDEFDDY